MAAKRGMKGAATALAKKAEQTATAAAPAAAGQLDTQPAAITEQPLTGAATADPAAPTLEGAGSTGQDAHLNTDQAAADAAAATSSPASAAPEAPVGDAAAAGEPGDDVAVLGEAEIAEYLDGLKAIAGDGFQLKDLHEPLLRQAALRVGIEGHDVLPPEQLVIQIEAKVGVGAVVTPAPSTDGPLPFPPGVEPGEDPLAVALSELQGGITSKTIDESEVPAVLSAGSPATDAVDDLADDGEVEGLWITAVPEQGFRRCGFRFTREGFGIALSALTARQIEQLEREPNLKVERGMFSGLVE